MRKLCYQVLHSSSQNYVSSTLFGVLNSAANYRALPRFSVMAGNTSTSSLNDDVTLNSDPQRSYQVVVAATRNMGIGKDGKLPWNLPSDLKFFKELTTSTVDPVKKNALVMGRKTWESIPLNYRPLPGRLNVVVTRSGSLGIDTALNVVLCGSISSTMKLLAQPPYSESIEKVFVIGGGQILKEALNAPQCDAIHITEVETSIDCDTFIPPVDFSAFQPWYSSLPLVENNIQFSFVTYARVRSSIIEHHTPSSGVKSSCSSNSNKFEVESFDFLPKMIFERHEENLYLRLIQAIISTGTMKDDRTGSGTLSRFRCQMRFNLRRSFPLLTTKRVSWQGVVEKVLWFISGSTNAKVLQENGIRIWNGNAFRDYLDSIGMSDREEETWDPFVDSSGETLVPGVGSDQLSDVVDKIKNGVDDKFIIFSSWNPSDLELMAPPTYDTFIKFYVDNGELSCQMHQHSADMGLVVPFNIACYALLTCLIAHVCGLTPGDFIHINGDAHVNRSHIRPLQEQLHKRPKPFPILEINPEKKDIYTLVAADFALTGYDPYE